MEETNVKSTAAVLMVVLAAIAIGGCSSEDSGEVTLVFAAGSDPSGATEALISEYNAAHPGVTVRFQAMPASTDTQHDAFVTYLSARTSDIDIYSLDVIWTAEFATAGWIREVPEGLIDRSEFLDGPLVSASYDGTLYAIPWFTDAGVLYYRKDLLDEAGLDVPETWDAFRAACDRAAADPNVEGFVWQGARYEGLVCNFLEFFWGVGVTLEPERLVNEPDAVRGEIVRALELMDGLIASGRSPESVLTYKEEDARRVFTEGQSLFLRNWPYAWSMAQGEGSKVEDLVGIARLPHGEGLASYSTIGGWNVAVSSYCRHPEEAFEFIAFITGERSLELRAIEGGYLPTRKATYADPDVLSSNPHFASFFEVFSATRNRPRSPHYPRASDVIQENVHGALTGAVDIPDAAAAMVTELAELLGEAQ
jgi:multiple sugar transport system substrate-binding protein